MIEAVHAAGLGTRTAIIVTADHGFGKVTKEIRPHVRFRKEGLIRSVQEGGQERLEYDAQIISEAGLALVYVPNGRFRPELVTRTRAALNNLEGVDRILEPKEYEELGMPLPNRNTQAPAFVITAKDGYSYTAATTGEEIVAKERPTGSHGYVHTNPKMDALFVAGGAGIKKGVRLERIRNIDVAPTIARLLVLPIQDADGQVVEAILE